MIRYSQTLLKVGKSRKQIMMSLMFPRNKETHSGYYPECVRFFLEDSGTSEFAFEIYFAAMNLF